ncbi:MAG: helix-turn-helix domain-containing protein [Pseudomonadales bacterium]|nr:helix-turn-helix domain-containing protein [Pseudomonadales bacterium]MBO6564424.1 helix-turn-helix domain-containing protein [Pseudomonadales bacterium]MBO6597168.1 helix-turn-helix domain-containing protein [Pseudomonadales bacterium]MBO6703799.1 helix-turn-helix domain-containing protein [Pseudomonadales bacterium]MBO6823645.1 helix-turn-helix domain-containing protein [Pseudomonadales bacterium]
MVKPADFVASYIEAWNEHNAKHVAEHLTPDGVYHDVPTKELHPRKELIAYLSDFFSQDQNHYELEGDITSGKDSIAFQYRVSSEEEDEIWFGAEFVTLQGDKAVQIMDYYREPIIRALGSGQKYAKSGLSDELLNRYKERLVQLMDDEKAFMNPGLTLPKLSSLVQCPINHLSQVINAGFEMSFFDYLNSHRIEEAKRILAEPSDHPQPILSVAFEVGFNSNSAFYSAFKRICGQTPAQFRKEQLASENSG